MKRTNYSIGILSAVLVAVLFLSSCGTTSITQRRYNKGLHIEWASKSKVKGAETVAAKKQQAPVVCQTETVAVVEAETPITLLNEERTESVIENTREVLVVKTKAAKVFNSLKKADLNNGAECNVLTTKSFSKKTFLKAVATKKTSSDLGTLILVIIAIFIPPLAVYLYEGSWTSRVTLSLILTLLFGGIIAWGIIGSLGLSLYLIPIIHALIVILT